MDRKTQGSRHLSASKAEPGRAGQELNSQARLSLTFDCVSRLHQSTQQRKTGSSLVFTGPLLSARHTHQQRLRPGQVESLRVTCTDCWFDHASSLWCDEKSCETPILLLNENHRTPAAVLFYLSRFDFAVAVGSSTNSYKLVRGGKGQGCRCVQSYQDFTCQ